MPLIPIVGNLSVAAQRGALNGNFAYLEGLTGNSRLGVTQAITVGPSPFTYTAGTTFEFVYLSGGSITSVTRHGTPLGLSVPSLVILPPGEAMTVTYSIESPPASPPEGVPTMVTDK